MYDFRFFNAPKPNTQNPTSIFVGNVTFEYIVLVKYFFMKKRNYIEEILNVKSREKTIFFESLYFKIEEINTALEKFKKIKGEVPNEIIRYFPITIVSCIQSYFRDIVIKLIDTGEPYVDNISQLNQIQNFKFNIEIIKALKKDRFSIGELVAHLLSCNNLSDFNKYISVLLKIDLLSELSKNYKIENDDLKVNFGEVISSVKNIFELRNIFCHEYAFNNVLIFEEVKIMVRNSILFLYLVNDYISKVLNPKVQEEEIDINAKSEKEYLILNEKVKDLVDAIIKQYNVNDHKGFFNENLFKESITKWREYIFIKVDSECGKLKNSKVKFIYFSLLNLEYKKKIEELEKQYYDLLKIDKKIGVYSNLKQHEFIKNIIQDMVNK